MKFRRVAAVIAHPISISALSALSVALSRDRAGLATRLGVGLPLGVLSSKAIKRMFPTRKPRWFMSLTPRESFPSGHSVAAAAYLTALVSAARNRRYVPLALAALGLVNAARVRSKQHRLRDVLVGDAIGIAAGVVSALVQRRLRGTVPLPARVA